MAFFELNNDGFVEIATTTFQAEGISERGDLQRHLRENIAIVAPGTMVLAEEFGSWDDSRRRIDLLCLDSTGTLVVVELKRTEDAGHVELQALRYAAMVPTSGGASTAGENSLIGPGCRKPEPKKCGYGMTV